MVVGYMKHLTKLMMCLPTYLPTSLAPLPFCLLLSLSLSPLIFPHCLLPLSVSPSYPSSLPIFLLCLSSPILSPLFSFSLLFPTSLPCSPWFPYLPLSPTLFLSALLPPNLSPLLSIASLTAPIFSPSLLSFPRYISLLPHSSLPPLLSISHHASIHVQTPENSSKFIPWFIVCWTVKPCTKLS